MYKKFFSLRERPFKLVPDPAYLFLSKNHEEVLAHLNYALLQGDGFVEITGEVGTGKTTMCRAFLEKLDEDDNAETAYIVNPKLDEIQLLKVINDEFGICSEYNNIKELVDELNRFLIQKKAEEKKVIIIIDEAQNLSTQVLEQLRLLSNLETTSSKLLQIVLVGQPELCDILSSYELRQLSQRINLNTRLLPFTYQETSDYINKRILFASKRPVVKFSESAFKAIYKYSRGVPRLINIICDRALLTGYVEETHLINSSIIKKVINEQSNKYKKERKYSMKQIIVVFTAIVLLLVTALIFYNIGYKKNKILIPDKVPVVTEPDKTPVITEQHKAPVVTEPDKTPVITEQHKAPVVTEPDKTPVITEQHKAPVITEKEYSQNNKQKFEQPKNFRLFLYNNYPFLTRKHAARIAFSIWKNDNAMLDVYDDIKRTFDFFNLIAKQNRFSVYLFNGNLRTAQNISSPAIFEFFLPKKRSHSYLTLTNIKEDKMVFKSGNYEIIEAQISDVKKYWSGKAYIFWRPSESEF